MTESFNCTDRGFFNSQCRGKIPIENKSVGIFIRCKDQPWLDKANQSEKRNANKEPIFYTLKKPKFKIKIDSVEPSSKIITKSPYATVKIRAATSGGGQSHICKYSLNGENTITFKKTYGRVHEQELNLPQGLYTVYINCEDFATGDKADASYSFEIERDLSEPRISRISQSSGKISFQTSEEASCRYSTSSCNFIWSKAKSAGTEKSHEISPAAKGTRYFIRCEDKFGNGPSGCSISVVAV